VFDVKPIAAHAVSSQVAAQTPSLHANCPASVQSPQLSPVTGSAPHARPEHAGASHCVAAAAWHTSLSHRPSPTPVRSHAAQSVMVSPQSSAKPTASQAALFALQL